VWDQMLWCGVVWCGVVDHWSLSRLGPGTMAATGKLDSMQGLHHATAHGCHTVAAAWLRRGGVAGLSPHTAWYHCDGVLDVGDPPGVGVPAMGVGVGDGGAGVLRVDTGGLFGWAKDEPVGWLVRAARAAAIEWWDGGWPGRSSTRASGSPREGISLRVWGPSWFILSVKGPGLSLLVEGYQ
jgi:hypothetical protein